MTDADLFNSISAPQMIQVFEYYNSHHLKKVSYMTKHDICSGVCRRVLID